MSTFIKHLVLALLMAVLSAHFYPHFQSFLKVKRADFGGKTESKRHEGGLISGIFRPDLGPLPQPDALKGHYLVRPGDTLLTIALRHGLTHEEILDLNPWLRNRPGLILVGEWVRIQ